MASLVSELEAVHAQATGSARGRRWGTTQLNRSLVVVLVAQFQAYARRLHDQAVDVHVAAAVPGQQALLFSFIDDLKAATASAASDLDSLEELIDFRNAVGHGDEVRIAAMEAQGRIKATKRSALRRRRAVCDRPRREAERRARPALRRQAWR